MKPFVGSYTNLGDFENCPRKFHHKHILKDLPREEETEGMRYGTLVHKLMEQRLGPQKQPLPGPFAFLEKWAAPIGDHLTTKVEDKLGMTAQGRATGFFADDVWFRVKADLIILKPPVAVLFDWKTGKKREDPTELAMQALLLKLKYPHIERMRGHYVWLKDDAMGAQHDLTEVASTFARIRNTMADIQAATAAGTFPPHENPLCGWCPVSSCEFNRRS